VLQKDKWTLQELKEQTLTVVSLFRLLDEKLDSEEKELVNQAVCELLFFLSFIQKNRREMRMGTFNTSRFISTELTNLSPVMSDVGNHFTALGYTVQADSVASGYLISLSRGGTFKSVLGMKTSLNVDIGRASGGYMVSAGVGIFGQQAVPSVISMFIAWPVLITQITGLVQQSKLDDEALKVVEESIRRHEERGAQTSENGAGTVFCTACGFRLPADSKFCSQCGAAQQSRPE
jgi:hypothetical protein